MPTRATLSYRDYSNELSRLSLNFATLQAGGGNFDAVTGLVDDVAAAILAVTDLVAAGSSIAHPIEDDTGGMPAGEAAQRERGIRIYYHDTAGKKHSFTIPGIDYTAITVPQGSDAVVLDDAGAMAALVTALEAGVKSPLGNAITVDRAVVIGRNS